MWRAVLALRERVVRELRPEDQILAEGPVGLGEPVLFAGAYLVVVEDRFLMVYLDRPDSVMSVPFDLVVGGAREPGVMKLTTRGWLTPLRPLPENPNDETDFYVGFGNQVPIEVALDDGLRRRSPLGEQWRQGVARFGELRGQPVSTWSGCPMCDSAAIERVDHAFRCHTCGRYFTEGMFRPDVSEDSAGYGAILGAKPRWLGLTESELDEFDAGDGALVWNLRSHENTDAPAHSSRQSWWPSILVPDYPIIEAMSLVSEHGIYRRGPRDP